MAGVRRHWSFLTGIKCRFPRCMLCNQFCRGSRSSARCICTRAARQEAELPSVSAKAGIYIEEEAWRAWFRLSINCNVFILLNIPSLRDCSNIRRCISIAIIHPLVFTVNIIAYWILPIELTGLMELVANKHSTANFYLEAASNQSLSSYFCKYSVISCTRLTASHCRCLDHVTLRNPVTRGDNLVETRWTFAQESQQSSRIMSSKKQVPCWYSSLCQLIECIFWN